MAMHPAVEQFVELLTEDVKRWEQAAKNVEAMLALIPEPERKAWEGTANEYRNRAAKYKSIIKQYLEDNKE